MSTSENQSSGPRPEPPRTRDRIYRSPSALVAGVLLLVVIGWLGGDAVVTGEGRTPWLALAVLLFLVPLVVAFTLRPAVFANEDRLRVRNPFRVVVLPWGEVVSLRSGYTNEVVAKSGEKFQLWSIPVSLRGRKKAARQQARRDAAARGEGRRRGLPFGGGFGGLGGIDAGAAADAGPSRAETDQVMDELREMQAAREKAVGSQGEVSVRWAYEVMGPAGAGAVLLGVLLVVG
ncbi:PH domain-containing protein [Streptomyces sp. NPDC006997]|uniref:PH domain-containing protein n=1 Tax=Streptomyces sp. NPDC006997 TaxID=3155356 RepID=UPI0033C46862